MTVKLLTEHHLEFLSLKGGCTGSSESTLVKMPHCWKSHVTAQIFFSGAEDKHGYLWDRHYGLCLKKYPHSDVVNSVAFNPMDPEVLVTVSDDFSIKIWRSLSRQKEVINVFNREHCIRLRHVRAIMSDSMEDLEQTQE